MLPSAAVEASLVVEDSGENAPRDFWLIGDHSYKAALQRYAFKLSARATAVGEQPPADFVPVVPVVDIQPGAGAPIPRELLDEIAVSTSAALRGMGLLWAVEFDSEISAATLTACNEAGLLLNAPKPTAVRLMPPLTVTRDEIDIALARLEAGIDAAAKGPAG